MSDAKRVRRRGLKDYPCPYLTRGSCSDECWCGKAGHCETRPIYEQAMADAMCARLLRVFERRWRFELMYAIEDPSGWWQDNKTFWLRWEKFIAAIRSALDAAGLL